MKTNPIHIKKSHKGMLHRALGVPAGKPIPRAKLSEAMKSSNPAMRKMANFAIVSKKWNK